MTDDKTNRGEPDHSRINVNEDYELSYWSKKWGVNKDELRRIVDKVGPMAADVAKKLRKTS